MFGALPFAAGYFAQGPPGTAIVEPIRPIDICRTTTRSLMAVRTTSALNARRATRSLMPSRTTEPICEGE